MDEKKLANIFNVDAFREEEERKALQGTILNIDPDDHDLDYVRDKLKGVIDSVQISLDEIASIASSSQSNKDYEALAAVTTALVNAAKVMAAASINKIKLNQIINQKKTEINSAGGNTNIIMVGSTTELQKMLKDLTAQQNGTINVTGSNTY
jgi:hypothetical protein